MNKELRVLSLFSGIGAFEKALTNLKINYTLINYCEIEEHASKCYSAIHGVDESLNLWDVTKINTDELQDFDLLTHGSPCQSFSINGKQEGGVKGSGTESSLLWETVRVIEAKKPKYVIWENVKNVLNPKHKPVLDEYLETLKNLGYTNYMPPKGYLSAKDFGIPQNRERVFIVSILGEHEEFIFPNSYGQKPNIEEFKEFREEDNITDKIYKRYCKAIQNVTKEEFIEVIEKIPERRGIGTKVIEGLYNYEQENRLHTLSKLFPTICKNAKVLKFYHNKNIYKISPETAIRLMGFDRDDYEKIKNIGTEEQIKNRAGNSIVVNCVEAIFSVLLKEYITRED